MLLLLAVQFIVYEISIMNVAADFFQEPMSQ